MVSESLTLAVAFGAGLLSCLSPCSLVLMPGFLSYMGAMHVARPEIGAESRAGLRGYRGEVIVSTTGFLTGFVTVFVLLGAALGLLSQVVLSYEAWISKAAGVAIIFLGLASLGLVRASFLEADYRLPMPAVKGVPFLSAFLVGTAFGIGWTPCTGATLTAILALAATSGSAQQGALLLIAYCLGLLVPMAAAGLLSGWLAPLIARRRAILPYFNGITGVFLIFLGIIIFTNRFTQLTGYLFFLGQ